MIPELTLPCGQEELICRAVSVAMYRRYTEIMEQNGSESTKEAFAANIQILKIVFPEASMRQIERCGVVEIMAAAKSIHFIMQDVITPKFLELNPEQQQEEEVEKETSAFDEYDEENGYNDEADAQERNIWAVCRENVDRVIKICIRVMKNSYKQCMDSDIMSLLDYVKFEIRTVKENEN